MFIWFLFTVLKLLNCYKCLTFCVYILTFSVPWYQSYDFKVFDSCGLSARLIGFTDKMLNDIHIIYSTLIINIQ